MQRKQRERIDNELKQKLIENLANLIGKIKYQLFKKTMKQMKPINKKRRQMNNIVTRKAT